MEAELDEVVGSKHAKNEQRIAVRHGHEGGEVTIGGSLGLGESVPR
jgi:hypothetical protein